MKNLILSLAFLAMSGSAVAEAPGAPKVGEKITSWKDQ